MELMKLTAKKYMENIWGAMCCNYVNLRQLYDGIEGNKRLAREFGYGLNDFSVDQHHDVIINSYSYLCVRFYDLKPFIDAKEWAKQIQSQIKNKEVK